MGLEGWVGIVAGKGVGTRVSLVLLFFAFAMPLAISASEDNPGILSISGGGVGDPDSGANQNPKD